MSVFNDSLQGSNRITYTQFCNSSSLVFEQPINKAVLKVIDLLGRETKELTNQPLFYIYDDGTVKKKIILEGDIF